MPSHPERTLDPAQCWIRHVRRTRGGEIGTIVASATFTRAPREALLGRQGWQSGEVSTALSDTGELTVVFPNAVGEDGIEHKRRFAFFTQDDYRPGEEWLEVLRGAGGPDDVLAVCTPYRGRKTSSTIELVGWDVAGQLNRFRGPELDPWTDGYAPRDVWEHYTRAPGLAYATDFTGFTAPLPWDGWRLPDAAEGTWVGHTWVGPSVGPHGGPRLTMLSEPAQGGTAQGGMARSLPAGLPTDCWIVDLRARILTAKASPPAGQSGHTLLGFRVGGVQMQVDDRGTLSVDANLPVGSGNSGPEETPVVGQITGFQMPAPLNIRVIAHYERMFVSINGVILAEWRRSAYEALNAQTRYPDNVRIFAYLSTVDIDSFHVEVPRPFALRGADKGSLRLPGIPPGGGLRARYYNAAATVGLTTIPGQASRLWPLSLEPMRERLEPYGPDLPLEASATSLGVATAWAGRWTGSIFLDLAASDRRLRLGEAYPRHRVHIGKTRRGLDNHYISKWTLADAGLSLNFLNIDANDFEGAAHNWATSGFARNAGASLTRISAARMEGTLGGRVTTTAAIAFQGIGAPMVSLATFLAGRKYRATAYLRGTVGGEQVEVVLGGAASYALVNATLPGPTQPPLAVHLEWTPAANVSATDGSHVIAIRSAIAAAMTFDVDRVRVIDTTLESMGPPLRAHLETQETGWYPIVIEAWRAGQTGIGPLEEAAVDANGNPATIQDWKQVQPSRLSPIGVYEEVHRHESHRAVIDALTETFGYQWRTDPFTLESGKFPGQIIPRVRVGRDTNKVIGDDAGVDAVSDSDSADTIDALVADAAGIADPAGSGQLTANVIDYPLALAHLAVASDYESLSEMTERTGLETRMGSLLALRSSPNEQVGVRPDGTEDLTDTFPLSGALSKLRWRPGDGVRLELKRIDVIDRTPRQLTRIQQTIQPKAIGRPVVGFRQRPRSPAAVLKRTMRAVYGMGRNYQGTLALISGTYITGTLASGAASGYSIIPLPDDPERITAVFVQVAYIDAGTVQWEVNSTPTGEKASAPGRSDLSPWVRQLSATDRRVYVRATGATAALTLEFQVQAIVRI